MKHNSVSQTMRTLPIPAVGLDLSVRFCDSLTLSAIFLAFTIRFPFVFAISRLCRRIFQCSHSAFRSFLQFFDSVGEIFLPIRNS